MSPLRIAVPRLWRALPLSGYALLLLRSVVGLEPEPECACLYYDECFDDGDCQLNGYPEQWYCGSYICIECDVDDQCEDGFVCDPCQGACVAE